ncbi:Flocculation suppression protein [Rhodosporidiobolus nylandii]
MLETPSLAHLISWSEDGKSFIIHHPSEFARLVLPQYFKHSNFSSFIRQQNFYGFAKQSDPSSGAGPLHTNPDGTAVQPWEFKNPNFQRGRPDLLVRIKRKTAKSNTTASPSAAVKRRSSVTTLQSLRPPRQESTASAEQAAEERESQRVLAGGLVGAAAAAAAAAGGPMRPPRSDYAPQAEVPPPPKRIAAGLADFAPYGPEEGRRMQDEPIDPPPGLRSPPSHVRNPALPPAPVPPYAPPPAVYSPGGQAYPMPPSSAFPAARYPPPDDPLARQIHTLEGQVRSLSEALCQTQHEAAVYRSTSYGVLHCLFSLAASLDTEGKRREEVEACSFALSKLTPEYPPNQIAHSTFPYPYHHGPAVPSWSSFVPPGHVPSPRPSTSTAHQYYYNRVPAVESYARSSRPDPAPLAPPAGKDSRPSSAAPTYPPQTVSTSTSGSVSSSAASSFEATSKPFSSASSTLPPITRSGANSSGAGGDNAGSMKLPPLSSLFTSSATPPGFGSGERRAGDGATHEDERARKKMRQ